MFEIIYKKLIADKIIKMKIVAPKVAKNAKPGQFILIRPTKESERIPLTIVDYSIKEQSVTIIFQVMGFTTEVLSKLDVGDSVLDFVGPLGKPTKLQKNNRAIGIAGGVGAGPLYPQLRALKELGASVDVIIGARNKNLIVLEEEFKKFCDNVYICTDDGSAGFKGLVTDKLEELIKSGNSYDEAIVIGPPIMMKFTSLLTKKYEIPTSVSLNPIMVDGTGMCGSCRVVVDGEIKFACVDGPDFDGHKVDFDILLNRLNNFKREEEDHKCRIGLDK